MALQMGARSISCHCVRCGATKAGLGEGCGRERGSGPSSRRNSSGSLQLLLGSLFRVPFTACDVDALPVTHRLPRAAVADRSECEWASSASAADEPGVAKWLRWSLGSSGTAIGGGRSMRLLNPPAEHTLGRAPRHR